MTYQARRPGAGTRRANQLAKSWRKVGANTPAGQAERRERLDAAKARIGIADAWRALRLPGEPRRACCSPFREERNPSFSVSADGRLWHDFAENAGGDVVDFVKRAMGSTDREAIARVLELAGDGTCAPVVLAPRTEAKTRPVLDGLSGLELREPTVAEVFALAELRDWPSFAGLEIARMRGLLRVADVPHRGEVHRAWILTDESRRSAQARRLDGKPWRGASGEFKSKSLRADAEAPPGLADVLEADRRAVLIAEGEPDALAALLLAWANEDADRFGVLCMPGASRPFTPAVLEKLKGRRCRVLRQADEPGHRCALAWAESLHAAGVPVDLANLDGRTRADGQPAKDLADLCRRPLELEEIETLSAELLGNFA